MDQVRKLKKVRFIYNPGSGETKVTDRLDGIIAQYQKRGFLLEPYRLDFSAGPQAMLAGVGRSHHHLLVAGGDGTVNYVVNAIKSANLDIPLAILPAGTANDFASMLGMRHTNLVKACAAMLDGEISRVDLGVVNEKYFVNVFSCGLFTDISQKTPTKLKNTFGKMAYYLGGISELTHFRRLKIRIDCDGEKSYDGGCTIFFVFNGRTAGKLPIAYLSEIDDGLLDVLIVKGDSHIKNFQTLMHYLSPGGVRKKTYPTGIEHFRCGSLRAECAGNETTDIDGQPGPGFPLDIRCEKGGLRVLRPKAKTTVKKR